MDELAVFLDGATGVYVVVSPTAVTSPDFPLRGYAGPSGRLDVVARAMTAPLTAEPTAASVGVLLGPPRPPLLVAGYRDCLGASERSAMAALRRLLAGRRVRGCLTAPAGVDALLHALRKVGVDVVLLREDGVDVVAAGALEGRRAYFAGAHVDMPRDIEAMVERAASGTVSLGPVSLHTSHAFLYVAWARAARRGGGCGGGEAGAGR